MISELKKYQYENKNDYFSLIDFMISIYYANIDKKLIYDLLNNNYLLVVGNVIQKVIGFCLGLF